MQLVLYDKCKQLETEELKEYMNQKMEVLIRAQNGEERYRESLGWVHVDEWRREYQGDYKACGKGQRERRYSGGDRNRRIESGSQSSY